MPIAYLSATNTEGSPFGTGVSSQAEAVRHVVIDRGIAAERITMD